jgi:hypothetical protein
MTISGGTWMTLRKFVTQRSVIAGILILQLISFVLFPATSFGPDSQEWWLPVLLGFLVLVADFELLFQRRDVGWPWYLISFAQGFNIISRLMMIMPHSSIIVNGNYVFNTPYVVLSIVSMLISTVMLYYIELPDVRMAMLRD